jgi:hypothetical protein
MMCTLKSILVVCALLTSSFSFSSAKDLGEVDLYVFSGQSNMKGSVSKKPSKLKFGPELIPQPYKSYFSFESNKIFQWNSNSEAPNKGGSTAEAFGNNFVPYLAGFEPFDKKRKTNWGPEVAFLYHRAQVVPNNIYFLKYAVGGTAIAFDPAKPANSWNADISGSHSLLDVFVPRVQKAVSSLQDMGYSKINVRFYWAQGESDRDSSPTLYFENFNSMFAKIKSNIEDDNVKLNLETMSLIYNPSNKYTRANINLLASHLGAEIVDLYGFIVSQGVSRVLTIDKIHLNPIGQDFHGTEMERISRLKERSFQDLSQTNLYSKSIKLPHKLNSVVFSVLPLPNDANGEEAFQIYGDTAGLAMDLATSEIKVTDLGLLTIGRREIFIKRHSPAAIKVEKLVLEFTQ